MQQYYRNQKPQARTAATVKTEAEPMASASREPEMALAWCTGTRRSLYELREALNLDAEGAVLPELIAVQFVMHAFYPSNALKWLRSKDWNDCDRVYTQAISCPVTCTVDANVVQLSGGYTLFHVAALSHAWKALIIIQEQEWDVRLDTLLRKTPDGYTALDYAKKYYRNTQEFRQVFQWLEAAAKVYHDHPELRNQLYKPSRDAPPAALDDDESESGSNEAASSSEDEGDPDGGEPGDADDSASCGSPVFDSTPVKPAVPLSTEMVDVDSASESAESATAVADLEAATAVLVRATGGSAAINTAIDDMTTSYRNIRVHKILLSIGFQRLRLAVELGLTRRAQSRQSPAAKLCNEFVRSAYGESNGRALIAHHQRVYRVFASARECEWWASRVTSTPTSPLTRSALALVHSKWDLLFGPMDVDMRLQAFDAWFFQPDSSCVTVEERIKLLTEEKIQRTSEQYKVANTERAHSMPSSSSAARSSQRRPKRWVPLIDKLPELRDRNEFQLTAAEMEMPRRCSHEASPAARQNLRLFGVASPRAAIRMPSVKFAAKELSRLFELGTPTPECSPEESQAGSSSDRDQSACEEESASARKPKRRRTASPPASPPASDCSDVPAASVASSSWEDLLRRAQEMDAGTGTDSDAEMRDVSDPDSSRASADDEDFTSSTDTGTVGCSWIKRLDGTGAALHDADASTPLPFLPPVRDALKHHPLVILTPSMSLQQELIACIPPNAMELQSYSAHHRTHLEPWGPYAEYHEHKQSKKDCDPRDCPTHEHCIRGQEDMRIADDLPLREQRPFRYLERRFQGLPVTDADEASFRNRPYVNNADAEKHMFKGHALAAAVPVSPAVTRVAMCAADASCDQSLSFLRSLRPDHPLHLGRFADHPDSISRLSNITWSGGDTPFMFVKTGFASFNLHIEQEAHCFYHHQLYGESIWVVVHPEDELRLSQIVATTILQTYTMQPKLQPGSRDATAITEIAFRAKLFFPPLSVLRQHRVRHRLVRVKAGDVLIGWGTLAHCGFGICPGKTVALACNLVTSDWLTRGGVEHIRTHFEWVKKMATTWKLDTDAGVTALERALSRTLKGQQRPAMSMYDFALSINHCPPHHSCSLLVGLYLDLHDVAGGGPSHYDEKYRTKAGRRTISKIILSTIALIHSLEPMLQKCYLAHKQTGWAVCSQLEHPRCAGLQVSAVVAGSLMIRHASCTEAAQST